MKSLMTGFFRSCIPLATIFLLISCNIDLKPPDENEKQQQDSLVKSKKTTTDFIDKRSFNTILQNDGSWRTAKPKSMGFNSELLKSAVDIAMADGTYTQAIVIIKNGKLVAERYRGIADNEKTKLSANFASTSWSKIYGERDKRDLATSWSIAKSITGALVAIALNQWPTEFFNDKASDYITQWNEKSDKRSLITIRDLLNMRSGLSPFCESESCEDDSGIVLSKDQLSVCIDREIETKSNSKLPQQNSYWKTWRYSNCDSILLGEIIRKATGYNVKDFADRNLFSKIDVKADWWQDNKNYLTYCCIDATPRDFAKFGQLILNYGRWDGEQVIPRYYIYKIKNIQESPNVNDGSGYGMQFWTFNAKNNTPIYYAKGYDGQFIMIDFENDLVVVRSSLYATLPPNQLERILDLPGSPIEQLTHRNIQHVNVPISLPGVYMNGVSKDSIDEVINFDEREFILNIIEAIE